MRETLPFLALPLPFCQRLMPLYVALRQVVAAGTDRHGGEDDADAR